MRRLIWLSAAMGMLSAVAMAFPARAATPAAPSARLESPYAAQTGAEFVTACNSDPASCDGKIANVLMSQMQYETARHLCLSGPAYARAVAPWLKAHPETATMNAEAAIVLALSALYKCGPPNNY